VCAVQDRLNRPVGLPGVAYTAGMKRSRFTKQ